MPLSDREQQILAEIESQLADEDSRFARTLRKSPLAPGKVRLRYAVAGLVVGFVMLLMIAVNPWGPFVALAGFALMLVSAVVVGNTLKALGSDRSGHIGGQLKGGFSKYLEGRRREDDAS